MPVLIALEAPKGAALEFGLLFAVILLGPIIVERFRIPGLIGILLGGYVIGPYGLGLIGPGNQTIPELGQFGLLYLMFVAGLELDLALLRSHRHAAISFGLLTFVLPFMGGLAIGLALGWELPATLLLGSLLASHTLILYPAVHDAGLGGNPALASSVGATVLTDTLALVVLAGVAGSETGSGSTATVLLEVGVGLVVLVVMGLAVLPRLAAWLLRLWGGDRSVRYVVAVLSFLLMAMISEVFGIEGIVGAFFAGLALNRLVPNEGPSMEHIEFFGSAVFVPVFLVSVGMLLDPSVMFTGETLGLAALLIAASMGGKALASMVSRPLLHFSGPEAGAVFALTVPQAAATLASTLVGFDIGLFGTTVVNAVLVLILVSIVSATLVLPHFTARIPPQDDEGGLGARVVLAAAGEGPSETAVKLVEQLTRAEAGIADVLVVHSEGDQPLRGLEMRALEHRIFSRSLDGSVRTTVDSGLAAAIRHGALHKHPTLIVVDVPSGIDDDTWIALTELSARVPVLVLNGAIDSHSPHIRLDDGVGASETATALAHDVAMRVNRGNAVTSEPCDPHALQPGDLLVVPVAPGRDGSAPVPPAEGAVVAVLAARGADSRVRPQD